MKKFIYTFLFFSLFSLLFVSCKDDDNVEPTVITAQNFTASLAENSAIGTTIGKIEATTNDDTDITYSIENQSPNGAVAINATTGELTVSDDSAFDYETNPTITGKIKLQANDVKKSISFTINVTDDTTDNIPTITAQDFTKTIAENSVANGDVLQALGATTTNGTLSYSIVTETPAGAVEVTSAGDVKVKDASLFDYEERQTVTASIKVASVEFPQVEEIIDFVITITDDTTDNLPIITVQDIARTRQENSVANFDLLHHLDATTTNGTLSYSIISETPAGAVEVIPTGYLRVKDASLFDFERYTKITGKIKVTSVEFPQVEEIVDFVITITNDTSDDDAILNILTDSKTVYENAADGDWVKITEAEYNKLYSDLNSTTKVGLPDNLYDSMNTTIIYPTIGLTIANSTYNATIPKNNYVVAFKCDIQTTQSNHLAQFKISENAINNGYSDYGNGFPYNNHVGNLCLVMKGATYKTTNVGYLALHTPYGIGYKEYHTVNEFYLGRGNVNTLNGLYDQDTNLYLFQGIATSEKQW